MKKEKFIPMKIRFEERAYSEAKQKAGTKIITIEKAFEWCGKHIDNSKIDKNKFVLDMTKEFSKCLKEQKGHAVKIDISIEKLMFLLDVDVSYISQLKDLFSKMNEFVEVKDGEFISHVDKEQFQVWTKDQLENDKLIAGNNLIKAIDLVRTYRTVYPLGIQQATSGFLKAHMGSQAYTVALNDN